MRIDNNTVLNDTAYSTDNVSQTTDDKTQKKQKTQGEGLSINGSELNLGEELVEEKRKKARSMAVQLIMDAFENDKKIDDDLAEKSSHAKKLLAENEEAQSKIADIEQEKKNTNELYGVDEGSKEWEQLKLLRKGREALTNPKVRLTEEERAEYRRLNADGLSDYHKTMLQLDDNEKIYRDSIEENNLDIIGDYAYIRGMNIERLKTHEMYDAKKQGEKIMEAASEEIKGMLVQEAVDKVDGDMQEEKEEALEKKEEQKELEERIEKARGEEHREDDNEEIYELDSILNDVREMNSQSAAKEAGKSMGLIAAELNLAAEDVKGLIVDSQV